jgi:MFS family permease
MTVSQFSQLHESFSALKIKQFRWFLLSAVGNSGGMQLQQLLRGYLVYDMTGSFAMLGLLSLLQSIPLLTLSMFGGVLADRMSKKLLVQIGHVVSGINVLVLAILLTQNALTIEILAITAIISGGTISIAMPARAAMIPHLVPKNSLTNAVILNGASMQVMRLIAPTIGGWATAVYGPDLGYFLNTGLFICGFIAIACTPFVQEDVVNNKNKENTIKSVLQDIKDTFTYLKNNEILKLVLITNVLVTMVVMPYLNLLPGYVVDIFNGGAGKLGTLMAVGGIGAFLGSMIIATTTRDKNRGILFMFYNILQAIGLGLLAISPTFFLACLSMIVLGIGSAGRIGLSQVLIQSYVEDAFRGRVLSIYMTQWSLFLIGAFLFGVMAEIIGVKIVFALCSLLTLGISFVIILFFPLMRKID